MNKKNDAKKLKNLSGKNPFICLKLEGKMVVTLRVYSVNFTYLYHSNVKGS